MNDAKKKKKKKMLKMMLGLVHPSFCFIRIVVRK